MEARELLCKIDFDGIDSFLTQAYTDLEKSEALMKEEEAKHLLSLEDAENIKRRQQELDSYLLYLQEEKNKLGRLTEESNELEVDKFLEGFENKNMDGMNKAGDLIDEAYEKLESMRSEINIMSIDNKILKEELDSVIIRDPERFHEQVEAELRLKFPDLFNETEAPQESVEEIGEDEVDDEIDALENEDGQEEQEMMAEKKD